MIDWAVSQRTLPGETRSGDRHIVRRLPRGVLIGVVDALGHGAEAARSAEIAVEALGASCTEPPVELVRLCHAVLCGRRGVVIGVASFDARDDTMTWLGIGNVVGHLLRCRAGAQPRCESLLVRSGIVGAELPAVNATVLPVHHGDTLAIATDGIDADFADELNLAMPPRVLADRILTRHARGTDDALVLVARYARTAHA